MTVDAELEVHALRTGGDRAGAADRLAVLDPRALLHDNVEQIAVQAERLAAVIDDDQIPESGKAARKRDDAVVDGAGVGPFPRRDLDAVGGRCATEPAGDGPGDRPFEGAAERAQRQLGRLDGRSAGREIAQRCLQFLLRGLELARQLRVQIALPVDIADEVGARLRGALRGGLRLFGGGAKRGEFRAAGLERLAFLLELGEGCGVRRDAIAIELGERGDGAGGLAEAAQVGGGEQEPEVARLAELVDLDQPLLQLGELGPRRGLKRVHARRGPVELGLDLRGVGVESLELLGLELALDLEPAEVAEQRALLGREAVGFALQRLEAFAGAPRERLGPRPLHRHLRPHRHGHHDDERRDRGDHRENLPLRILRALRS